MSTHGSSTHGSSYRPPRPDPLTEIVLCPTTGRPLTADPSRVEQGRAVDQGSASMAAIRTAARSRAAILDGARDAVLAGGTKVTMSQVAARAGVAKATLYNHYRVREEVLAELLLVEIEELIATLAHLRLADALTSAALAVSEHPLLEALGAHDSTALSVLGRVDVGSAGWARVAQATDRLLASHGRRGTPTVLRWLSSFVIAPAEAADIAADVEVLIAGLPPAR
jgi:AcrR family transcriptional regulator